MNVLLIQRSSATDRARIEAVDQAIRLIDAGGWFDGEIRETWPAFSASRYLAPGATGQGTREERDKLLAEAEVILGGWPFPLDLRARAKRLKWFHQRPAGASNLRLGDRVASAASWRGPNTRLPAFCISPNRSTARRARSITALTGHCCWKARRYASSALAVSAARSGGLAPRWGCV
jgi:hypothetical protein